MKIIPIDLKPNSNILISGCGGGFDVIVGIPLALELENQGHFVVFSSYSFSDIHSSKGSDRRENGCVVVSSDSSIPIRGLYFPEKYLSDWFRTIGKRKSVYCYREIGVQPLVQIFDEIAEEEGIDYHFIIDGGSDGIFRGDEFGLGSPLIDAISIIAASQSQIKNRYYVLSAFGTEGVGNNEVSHAEVLERMSDLIASNKMHGVTSIINHAPIAKQFGEAFDYICSHMPSTYRSTIAGSIASSLKGDYGSIPVNNRTIQNPVWISPLTSLLWYFDCDAVARMKLYYGQLKDNVKYSNTRQMVWEYWMKRESAKRKKPMIPI